METMPADRIALLDELLAAHAGVLGGDFEAYRNHTYRVLNLALALSGKNSERVEELAIAAAFHDMGIWSNHTFDYLAPSAELARAYLRRVGKADWSPEIVQMILQHHKITRYRGESSGLVESFRRADWVDVLGGARTFGLPRSVVRELYTRWPDHGFHKKLLELALQRARKHPFSPLPMVRL